EGGRFGLAREVEPGLRAEPLDERRDHVGKPAWHQRLQGKEKEQRGRRQRGAGRRRGPPSARVAPPAADRRLARPARRDAASQVRADGRTVTDRTEPAAPPRPCNPPYRHFAHL